MAGHRMALEAREWYMPKKRGKHICIYVLEMGKFRVSCGRPAACKNEVRPQTLRPEPISNMHRFDYVLSRPTDEPFRHVTRTRLTVGHRMALGFEPAAEAKGWGGGESRRRPGSDLAVERLGGVVQSARVATPKGGSGGPWRHRVVGPTLLSDRAETGEQIERGH